MNCINVLIAAIFVGFALGAGAMLLRMRQSQPEGTVGVIEAFGGFARVVEPGLYILLPWETCRSSVPLQLFIYETPEQTLLTKGGASMKLKMVVHYQLSHDHKRLTDGARVIGGAPPPRGTNAGRGPVAAPPAGRRGDSPRAARLGSAAPTTSRPGLRLPGLGRRDVLDAPHAAYRAVYAVENWRHATEEEAIDVLHETFAKLSIGDNLIGDDEWQTKVGEQIREQLSHETERWGAEIRAVKFKEVNFSDMTMKNLYAPTRLQREGMARRQEAQVQREIADMFNLDSEAVLRWRYIDAMREIAQNPQARIILSSGMVGAPVSGAFQDEHGTPEVSNLPAFPPHAAQFAPPTAGALPPPADDTPPARH